MYDTWHTWLQQFNYDEFSIYNVSIDFVLILEKFGHVSSRKYLAKIYKINIYLQQSYISHNCKLFQMIARIIHEIGGGTWTWRVSFTLPFIHHFQIRGVPPQNSCTRRFVKVSTFFMALRGEIVIGIGYSFLLCNDLQISTRSIIWAH